MGGPEGHEQACFHRFHGIFKYIASAYVIFSPRAQESHFGSVSFVLPHKLVPNEDRKQKLWQAMGRISRRIRSGERD